MKVGESNPLVEVTRGEIVESLHYGAFIVVDSDGKIVWCEGSPSMLTYPRSSIKPFQALPLIEHGGDQVFHLTPQEIAITCASHSGTELHRDVLRGMHAKIGLKETDLACGVHWPGDAETRAAMRQAGEQPTPFHHNCSGKHTGMLALACLLGQSTEGYLDPQHPIQVIIRETLADMIGLPPESMPVGVDGCSAPVYGIPLYNMAWAVARLVDPIHLDDTRASACQKITSAMIAHPVMIAGPGKFDTDLMEAAGGKLISKGGAEGYQIIGILPGVNDRARGLGVAIKISDGDPRGRARSCVSLSILDALGVLDREDLSQLSAYGNVPVKNWRQRNVGEVRPAFSIAPMDQN